MNNIEKLNIQNLRSNGYKVRVHHYRRFRHMDRDEVIIFPYSRKTKTVPEFVGKLDNNGGFTTVEVTNPNGVTTVGHAKCHNADIFNYRRGVEIALNRAMGS